MTSSETEDKLKLEIKEISFKQFELMKLHQKVTESRLKNDEIRAAIESKILNSLITFIEDAEKKGNLKEVILELSDKMNIKIISEK